MQKIKNGRSPVDPTSVKKLQLNKCSPRANKQKARRKSQIIPYSKNTQEDTSGSKYFKEKYTLDPTYGSRYSYESDQI